jgi:hypothetical protein
MCDHLPFNVMAGPRSGHLVPHMPRQITGSSPVMTWRGRVMTWRGRVMTWRGGAMTWTGGVMTLEAE